MPKIRSIKPDFFHDETLATIPYIHRLAFIGLWCWADRDGKLEDRPEYLKAMLFPYENNVDIEKILTVLFEKRLIHRYLTESHRYIKIMNFKKHQRPHHTEKESEIPEPIDVTEIHGEVTVNSPLTHGGSREGREGKGREGSDQGRMFEEFWKAYPKKVAKEKAKKAFNGVLLTDQLFKEMISALKAQSNSAQWLKDGGQFIPYPASWLNGRRWEDNLEVKQDNEQPHPYLDRTKNVPNLNPLPDHLRKLQAKSEGLSVGKTDFTETRPLNDE